MNKQKNILLIVVDCLRADFVYEPGKAFLPTIGRLWEEGFSFSTTIAVTSTTTPSFASLLTGLYPYEHGIRSLSGYGPGQDLVFFPDVLRKAGYNTYAEVTGPLVEQMGFSRFFDHYNYRDPESTIHTEWGLDLLKKLNHYKEPWFVLLHIWSLHIPRVVIDKCDNVRCGRSLYARAVSSVDEYLGKLVHNIDENTIVVITADHGEQIASSRLDAFLKKWGRRLYRKLRHNKLTNMHFAKGMRRFYVGHGYSIYDVLVKVPLIFYNKEIVPPGESACQIRQIDIFPTILGLIGENCDASSTGESAVPIMKGSSMPHRDAYLEAVGTVIPSRDEWLAGIRVDNKYKYIYSPFRDDFEEELYDLENDPQERHNIARENRDIVDSLEGKIQKIKFAELTGQQIDEEEQKAIMDKLQALGYVE